MQTDKVKRNKDDKLPERKLKVCCTYCGSESTVPVDHKKTTDGKTIYVCVVCGQSFEHERIIF